MARVVRLVVAASLALVVAWVAFRLTPPWKRVPDVTTSTEVTLHAKPLQRRIYSLDIVGFGNIDGDAEISLVLSGEPYKDVKLHGHVRFLWGGDWYSPTAVVRYTVGAVKGGSLVLRYRFNDL
jgi:hypothetical protein